MTILPLINEFIWIQETQQQAAGVEQADEEAGALSGFQVTF